MRSVWMSLACVAGLCASAIGGAAELPLAMDGKCPVCLVKMDKLVDGKAAHTSKYDGKTYRFPSAEQKRMFDADPAAFVPALGGDCTVCLVELGKRVAGSPEHALVHNGRLYLFPGREQLEMFKKNPARYANADVALGGNCAVCKVALKKDVPGKPEIAADYRGMRYYFPDEKTRDMFLAEPDKYATN